jgi:hypothetical protein
MKKGFFAYSNTPPHSAYCVEGAIREINNNINIELQSWKSCSDNGRIVIDNITQMIDKSDYFCADITGMSNNVLFELGYATAKGKNVFLILDRSLETYRSLYRELTCLNTYAYDKYSNIQEIVDCFFTREPHIERRNGTLNIQLQPQCSHRASAIRDRKALLYLKGGQIT